MTISSPLIIVGSLVCMSISVLFPSYRLLHFPSTLFGLIFIAAGLIIALQGRRILARHNTSTTAGATPSHLTTEGIFGYSRNPMYLGGQIIIVGLACLFGTISAVAICVGAFAVYSLQIRAEEKDMKRVFGKDFITYARRVRRWI